MFIVFDSNIWISQLALHSRIGAAVRFFLQKQQATVVVPEVVRLEVERNLTRTLCELREKIRNGHQRLLTVFGTLKEVVLPTDEQIQEKVAETLSQLDVPIKEIPFSLEAARSSFLKTINKLPPSEKSQQFKDGVIWAHCVDLLAEGDVCLVTDDRAFYEGQDKSKGLAGSLKDEVTPCKHKLTLIPDLSALLDDIREDVQIDENQLVEVFLLKHRTSIDGMLDRHGFMLEGPSQIEVKLFATEVATRLYVEFEITFQCSDVTDLGRADAIMSLPGDGWYDTSSEEYLELRNQGEKLEYTDEKGRQTEQNFALFGKGGVFGHRSVQYAVKYPLS